MFGAGVGVLVHEGYHAAVISVPFQSASSLLIPAGICSVVAGCLEILVTRFTDSAPSLVHKRSLAVILFNLLYSELFKYIFIIDFDMFVPTVLMIIF